MLRQVCAVLDFECFHHKTLLFYREIGFAPIHDDKVINLHITPSFLPPCNDRALWRTFNTLKFFVHGLDLYPDQNELQISQDSVSGVIRALYQYAKTPEQYIIAYKGGNFERQILQHLNIPHINLEEVGCPAYGSLSMEEKAFYTHFDCGQHRHANGDVDHCPAKEVSFYRHWILGADEEIVEPCHEE